jgi:hypothetical protein
LLFKSFLFVVVVVVVVVVVLHTHTQQQQLGGWERDLMKEEAVV